MYVKSDMTHIRRHTCRHICHHDFKGRPCAGKPSECTRNSYNSYMQWCMSNVTWLTYVIIYVMIAGGSPAQRSRANAEGIRDWEREAVGGAHAAGAALRWYARRRLAGSHPLGGVCVCMLQCVALSCSVCRGACSRRCTSTTCTMISCIRVSHLQNGFCVRVHVCVRVRVRVRVRVSVRFRVHVHVHVHVCVCVCLCVSPSLSVVRARSPTPPPVIRLVCMQ